MHCVTYPHATHWGEAMNQYLRNLMTEREALIQTATGLADAAAEAGRDMTETEQATLAGMQARGAEIDAQLATYGSQLDSQRAYASLRQRLGDGSDDSGQQGGGVATLEARQAQTQGRSWGEQVVSSGILDSYSGHGRSDQLTLPGVLTRAAIDPISLADLPPAYTPHHIVEPAGPTQPFPLLTLVSTETVSSNSVDFIRWEPVPVPAAAMVPEGALKPAMDIIANVTSATLDTYAGWKPVTRQALEDYPRIQSIVEGKLRTSLLAAASAAIAALLNAAAAGAGTGGGSLSAAIRVAVGELQAKGYSPNAVALNPADWAALDVSDSGLYNPGGTWGLTPVAVPELAAGTTVVGDFKSAITLFDRGQTSVFVTDSHADFFLRNTLVILAEARMLAAAVEPAAMQKVTVGVAPAAAGARSNGK